MIAAQFAAQVAAVAVTGKHEQKYHSDPGQHLQTFHPSVDSPAFQPKAFEPSPTAVPFQPHHAQVCGLC